MSRSLELVQDLRRRGLSFSPRTVAQTARARRAVAGDQLGRAAVLVNGSSRLVFEPGASVTMTPGSRLLFGVGGTMNVLHADRLGAALVLRRDAVLAIDGPVKFGYASKVRVSPGARLSVGSGTSVNALCRLLVSEHVSIGAGCTFAWGVTMMDTDFHPVWPAGEEPGAITAPIHIGDRVWIGAEAMVLKGVTIHDGAVVAARSVVTTDVPARSLVAGNPARIVRNEVDWQP